MAFQYSLDESRHYVDIFYAYYNSSTVAHTFVTFILSRDCKLLASPTSGKKIKGNYLTGLPKCPSGK